jgi:hypothetical protein
LVLGQRAPPPLLYWQKKAQRRWSWTEMSFRAFTSVSRCFHLDCRFTNESGLSSTTLWLCEESNRVAAFDFGQALPGPPRHAYHVDRSIFDGLVRDCALEHGAEVRHGVVVRDVQTSEETATVVTEGGELTARFVIDATGQGRLLGKRKKSIRPYRHFGKAAVFAHFDGLSDAGLELIGEGNDIRIMMVPDGWAWVIPLPNRRLSIGLVSRLQGLNVEDFENYVANSPLLSAMTAGCAVSKPQMLGNFSFKNTEAYGQRYACVGDAACFIDPVFSSGVCLGMNSAVKAADRLLVALASGTEADPELMIPLQTELNVAYDTFCSMVYRFYNTRFVDNMIFGAPDDGDLKPAVTSVLGGDVWRKDNVFRDMLLRARSQPWQDADTVSPPAA